jgi:hypothetical protein
MWLRTDAVKDSNQHESAQKSGHCSAGRLTVRFWRNRLHASVLVRPSQIMVLHVFLEQSN